MRRLWYFLAMPLMAAPGIDFQRDVRPVLSDNCFHCHGPDKSSRMAGMRLDTREGAFGARKNGTPIVAGDPAASLIYQRITQQDLARRMPPEGSHKSLTTAQIDLLKRWIENGADWKEHWAFVPPTRPALPAVKNAAWVRTPIDRFVLARLEAAGLTPAPEADRRTLARRASLDITGLPPSQADLHAFLNDQSEGAYERYVDTLFASPHYGEHRARYWLDAARYADTHGLHIDNYREMWLYRDWVIKAFNANKRFDTFVLEQLAGDLLPDRTVDQQIASGFQRCNVTTNEGGVIPDEVAAIYAKDRVDTTGTVFLGLTIGCATCHDHKFDPILQKDFYAMAAFYRNTTQRPLDGNISDTPPMIVVPSQADRPHWNAYSEERRVAEEKVESARNEAAPALSKWLGSQARRSVASPLSANEPILTAPPVAFPEKQPKVLPNFAYFDIARPFTLSLNIFNPKKEEGFTVLSQIEKIGLGANGNDKEHGLALEINGRAPALRLLDPEGKAIQARAALPARMKPGEWSHLVVTYDGSGFQAGLRMYFDGVPAALEGSTDPKIKLNGNFKTGAPFLLGGDGSKRFFVDGEIKDLRIFNRVVTPQEAVLLAAWPAGGDAAYELYYLNNLDKGYRAATADLWRLDSEHEAIRRRSPLTLVMQEKADSKPTANILYRGLYDQPRQQVDPAVPTVLPQLTAAQPKNRLGLAEWMISEENPLLGRVTVNRFWQQIFGTGIVKTAEDFGSQGEAPSHPELLDWLAVEFRDTGWDTKHLLRTIVTSAAYRQSAISTPEKLTADPDNRMLSRGPRFRLDGELVRDLALASSGLLVETVGGPSVKPYQPAGIWETVAMKESDTRFYKQDSGDKLYRRSLYTFWKRSAPPASMEIFNAPSRETCTVRRERTDTPLQALVTMNDPQFVEAARYLAQSAPAATFDATLDSLTERTLARLFNQKEREITHRSLKDYLAYYRGHQDAAARLLHVGAAKVDSKLPPADLAAWTMVASQILNLDESLNK